MADERNRYPQSMRNPGVGVGTNCFDGCSKFCSSEPTNLWCDACGYHRREHLTPAGRWPLLLIPMMSFMHTGDRSPGSTPRDGDQAERLSNNKREQATLAAAAVATATSDIEGGNGDASDAATVAATDGAANDSAVSAAATITADDDATATDAASIAGDGED